MFLKQTNKSALHFAASCGAIEVCRAMLQKGANPNVFDKQKRSPAHEAAAKGHFQASYLI